MNKMKHTIKKSVAKYLVELLIVAFGVFLGIMVSEQKAKNRTNENISNSRDMIVEELEVNRQNLVHAVEYHEKIKKGFDTLKTNLSEDIIFSFYFSSNKFRQEQIPGWSGLGIYKIEDVAFESAKISGIFHSMDINDVKQISSAYRQLHSYSEFGTMITQKVIAMDSQTKILDVVGILEMLTNDFLNNEKHLMNDLDKTIAKLKEEN
ncbi:MAG: hypothetical protein RBT05_12565 [Bacteroidales bacterium]|jgi:hypothetical protein|nr:hypothetical protein [Bacteroidales bacterium]